MRSIPWGTNPHFHAKEYQQWRATQEPKSKRHWQQASSPWTNGTPGARTTAKCLLLT